MKHLVIIGSGGQLGWELCRQSRLRGIAFTALDFPDINITDYSSIKSCLETLPVDVVVNAAAYTAVDRAESEPDAAFAVNCDGPANLAGYCSRHGIALIHISTDYVFDGSKSGAYLESDPVAPLGVYGKSKEAGEREVRACIESHLIIRTAWLYGVHGNNFVKTMQKLGRECECVRVVADQRGCPTYAADLADAILSIAARYSAGKPVEWGTYHFCGGGPTTWHRFAEAVLEHARRNENLKVKEVMPISTDQYPTAAKRPFNSVLDCTKIGRNLGIETRPWEDALSDMMQNLYAKGNLGNG